jgi:molybdate transport system substrate-binding protein
METRRILLAFLLAAGTLGGGPAFGAAPEITLSAAASLTGVLEEIKADAERLVGARILLNTGASGTLRHQIEQGAPVDVFFSAARQDMDLLESKGLIVPETRHDLLGNSLVLIGVPGTKAVSSRQDLQSLLSSASLLAIGDPDVVPAGRYAMQALTAYALEGVVRGKTAHGGSVREVLQFVQSGSAPLGIVFLTDALSAKPAGSVETVYAFPNEILSTPIVYPAAVVAATKNRPAAERLVEFLRGDVARQAFRRAGFTLP